MNDGLKYFIFLAFAMMVLQSFLSYLQYKSYQKAVSALQGRGWILGIGMRKGDTALKNEIDKIIQEMIDDGTYKTISEKWFGKDVSIKK